MLRALIVLALVAAAGWFGWWFWASAQQEAALSGWLAERRAAGWQAEAGDLSVSGFPNRLDARLEDLKLADPASGWAWEAPWLDIYQLVYDPRRAIVHWPAEQQVAAPGARATVRSEVMRASAAFADAALSIERHSLEIVNAGVAADAGWTASVARYQHHLRRADPETSPAHGYAFKLDAERLRPPKFLTRMADPAGALPAYVAVLAAEGRVALDRPLDRYALEGAKPQVTALSLSTAEAVWGDLELSAKGSARADAAGYAEGEFDISARNWRRMIDMAVATGAIGGGFADTLKGALGFLARLGGDPDALEATLVLSGGFARLGPVPIGPAPRLLR